MLSKLVLFFCTGRWSEKTAVLWRGMGETVRVVQEQGVEQILYSGYRLERVK
jgi:hypothetical protein